MKRWYVSLSERTRWWVTAAAFTPLALLVVVVTDDSWLGWLLSLASGACCGGLAGVITDHFDERGEQV